MISAPIDTIISPLSPDTATSQNKNRLYRVLSLDGGGIRGVAVARVLEEIETRLKKPIHEVFDLVIGTSTGGILTVLMTVPQNTGANKGQIISAATAKQFYYDHAAEIFAESIWQKLGQLTNPKHNADGLINVVRKFYTPDTTLRHAKIHAGVVATDKAYNKSVVFNTLRARKFDNDWRHNTAIENLVRATSAAPSYFPHVELKAPSDNTVTQKQPKTGPRRYSIDWRSNKDPFYTRSTICLEDGGCSHNNPAWLGFKLIKKIALHDLGSLDNVTLKIVSIGTGTLDGLQDDPADDPSKYDTNDGLVGTAQRLTTKDPFFMDARTFRSHEKVDEEFQGMNQSYNYQRVEFQVSQWQLDNMDSSNKKNMDSLMEGAEKWLFVNGDPKVPSPEFTSMLKLIDTDAYHMALGELADAAPSLLNQVKS